LARFDSVSAVDSPLTSPSTDTPPDASAPARRKRSKRGLAVVGALLTGLLMTGCTLPSFGEYKGSTSQGRSEFHLWQGFFIAGLIVGGFVLLLILWVVFRYRKRSDEMPRQTQYHTVLEILYTVVPVLIVFGLFIATVFTENTVDANPTATDSGANVAVHAFQWGWEFVYPNGAKCPNPTTTNFTNDANCVKIIGQTTNAPTMMVPAGTSTHIALDSLDVLHGFYVPQFNFSRYASPGYTTSFNFNVLHPGVYRGQCTQLCGLYHSLMFFNVKAVSRSAYDNWLASADRKLNAHPSTSPKLPSGVHGSTPSGGNIGGDLYGD
jgi:cytochrome c oxidase subunit 2